MSISIEKIEQKLGINIKKIDRLKITSQII